MAPTRLFPTLLTGLLLLLTTSSFSQQAQSDPSLKPSLEGAYNAWQSAVATQDLGKWEAVTAFSRQIEIRNIITSQKLPFPAAFFADPIPTPSLNGLISLGILSTGQTATSTYFGKADFGAEPGVAVADNFLVLHFLREEGTWKFDQLRIVKPGDDGELLLQIRNSDFSFLTGAEFQPAAQLPPVPQPVNQPDYIAEAWINASGYEITLNVNGRAIGTFANMKTAELVIGGLNRGANTVKIQAKPVSAAGDGVSKVEVAIYSATSPEDQAARVFHYNPASPDAEFTGTIVVD